MTAIRGSTHFSDDLRAQTAPTRVHRFPTHQFIDFNAVADLFHSNLLRRIEGDMGPTPLLDAASSRSPHLSFRTHYRFASFSTSARRSSTSSAISTRFVASGRKPSYISFKREGYLKRSVATLQPPCPPPALGFDLHLVPAFL